jgi:hypothetical protein
MGMAFPLAALAAVSVTVWGCGSTGSSPGAGDGGSDAASTDGGNGDGGGGDGATGGDGAFGAPCHNDADCNQSFEYCRRVEDPQCPGAAHSLCMTDGDCADAGMPNTVCVVDACMNSQCQPKCMTTSDCPMPASQACQPVTGHCDAKACGTTNDCPANFACPMGTCTPATCTMDSQCLGACVDKVCSSAIGVCTGRGA